MNKETMGLLLTHQDHPLAEVVIRLQSQLDQASNTILTQQASIAHFQQMGERGILMQRDQVNLLTEQLISCRLNKAQLKEERHQLREEIARLRRLIGDEKPLLCPNARGYNRCVLAFGHSGYHKTSRTDMYCAQWADQ